MNALRRATAQAASAGAVLALFPLPALASGISAPSWAVYALFALVAMIVIVLLLHEALGEDPTRHKEQRSNPVRKHPVPRTVPDKATALRRIASK